MENLTSYQYTPGEPLSRKKNLKNRRDNVSPGVQVYYLVCVSYVFTAIIAAKSIYAIAVCWTKIFVLALINIHTYLTFGGFKHHA